MGHQVQGVWRTQQKSYSENIKLSFPAKQVEDILFKEEVLVISICLSKLLEILVLSKNIVCPVYGLPQSGYHVFGGKETHGNIIRVPVFLSWYCLGPPHFLHTHL